MAFVIAAPCVDHSDQSCVAVCPVDCIWGDLTVDRKLYVDPGGLHRVRVVPAGLPQRRDRA